MRSPLFFYTLQMDPITQGLLGGSAALVLRKKNAPIKKTKTLYVVGFVAGMMADLDVLIRSQTDPLLTLDYHRAFTHALLFIPIGAAVATLALRPILKIFKNYELSTRELFLSCLLGYATHAPLDALTNYGTSLFLPLSPTRISLNLMAVVDPFFTLPLIALTIWGLAKNSNRLRSLLASWMILIFGFNFANKLIATSHIKKVAHERGHEIEELLVKPTLLNGYLWRTVYRSHDTYYTDAIFALPGWVKHYSGGAVPVFNRESDYPNLPRESVAATDIERFRFFSDNLLGFRENAVIDVRFSVLPHGTRPLWSVMPKEDPEQHVYYLTDRPTGKRDREIMFKMLLGQDIAPEDEN